MKNLLGFFVQPEVSEPRKRTGWLFLNWRMYINKWVDWYLFWYQSTHFYLIRKLTDHIDFSRFLMANNSSRNCAAAIKSNSLAAAFILASVTSFIFSN